MALVDESNKWTYLEKSEVKNDYYSIKTAFSSIGQLNLFAKFGSKKSFDSICSYEIF